MKKNKAALEMREDLTLVYGNGNGTMAFDV